MVARRPARDALRPDEAPRPLVTPPDGSAAQELAERVPEARVVKAFNTTFAPTLSAGGVGDHNLDVLVAGDDEPAKRVLSTLIEDGGQPAIDVGPLKRARELAAAGLLHRDLTRSDHTTGRGALATRAAVAKLSRRSREPARRRSRHSP